MTERAERALREDVTEGRGEGTEGGSRRRKGGKVVSSSVKEGRRPGLCLELPEDRSRYQLASWACRATPACS